MRGRIGSRRARRIATLAIALATLSAATFVQAEPIADITGQMVDRALDERVSAARALRVDEGQQADIDRSIAMLEQITSEKPDYYRAWYNLALGYLQKDPENVEPALKAFQMAAEIQASDANIRDGSLYNSFGWALLNARQYSAAEENLNRGLALADTNTNWTNSALNYNLGRLYFEQGDMANAEQYLNVAIDKYQNGMAVELKAIMEKMKQ